MSKDKKVQCIVDLVVFGFDVWRSKYSVYQLMEIFDYPETSHNIHEDDKEYLYKLFCFSCNQELFKALYNYIEN